MKVSFDCATATTLAFFTDEATEALRDRPPVKNQKINNTLKLAINYRYKNVQNCIITYDQ